MKEGEKEKWRELNRDQNRNLVEKETEKNKRKGFGVEGTDGEGRRK